MKALQTGSIRGWGKIAVPVLVVLGIALLPLGQQTSVAGELVSADQPVAADRPSAPISQIELLQWLVHLRGAEASLPTAATTGDYVDWARSQNIEPQGGWNPGAALTRSVFAQTLAQFFGLNVVGQDPIRALEMEGVAIPAADVVTRSTLVDVVGRFGFQSHAGVMVQSSATKVKGNNGVGNGLDPAPPGNPKPNDGPGTGPGNPGNNPPSP
jgi:hypothetical protein